MSSPASDDSRNTAPSRAVVQSGSAVRTLNAEMTSFIESCVETTIDSASSVHRNPRHGPRARKLLRILKDARSILITTHQNPDPDALASSYALAFLLRRMLPQARIVYSVKGSIGGGYNKALASLSQLRPDPWPENLDEFNAILLLDVQPDFKLSPLPQGRPPTAVIDHHRSRGRRPRYPFSDIRTDVGATSSIIFSYFMELDVDIPPDLAATLLFAIETDLAGAAGQPGELDNIALSSLTLMADTRRLYKLRYVSLPQGIYTAMAQGLSNAVQYGNVMLSHLPSIESPESPAVIADFLLRYDPIQWVLVTALNAAGDALVMSLRTNDTKASAADVMRRLLRGIGEGGGHRTKAGGSVQLAEKSPEEIERIRTRLRRRLMRSVGKRGAKAQKLV